MTKSNLKYIIYLVVLIFLLFFVSAGIALLLKKDNTVVEKDVSLVADNNTISIKSIISVSDEFGKNIDEDNNGAFGYLKFDVLNNTDETRNFQIFVTKKSISNKEISSRYITLYLTDDKGNAFAGYTGNILPTYDSIPFIDNKPDSKSLFDGSLEPNEKKSFILRVWIAENYVVSEEETFAFDIGARAI